MKDLGPYFKHLHKPIFTNGHTSSPLMVGFTTMLKCNAGMAFLQKLHEHSVIKV